MYNLSQFIDLSLAHLPSHLAAQRFEPRKLPSLASCFLRRTVESCLKGYLRTCYILLQLCTFNSLQYTTFFVREPITQSGWKLLRSPRGKKVDPVFWVSHCKELLHDRREAAKCSNLFVHLRGQPKAASRTVIAGWVRTLLAEAGIIASPGSIRSAVASKNWADNVPIDDILSRGNWRSENTFRHFYRREIIKVPAQYGITNSFVPYH
ncbi:uncharacterized protein LOC120634945 isoform X1 [Pararge aegeria]|nr:uncharacterized protein LOC120633050 [Pararge aegeria]XP_039761777.1 uncharacterized protein LOC120634945 isoform X1 [Pararge aegeria]